MASPMGRVTPGALNFTGASRKLMEQINPNHTKAVMPEIIV
jgi:hypothetical protein